jgi:hypothetical protein
MKLDDRFLTVHPATSAWWAQRSRCRKCESHHVQTESCGATMERCAAVADRKPGPKARGDGMAYCIDARLDGAPCGPKAELFKAKG